MASAYQFRTITNDELNEVQEFVRRDLLGLLEQKAAALGRELSYDEREAFFGLYASSPLKFSFLGERKMIVQMANYVREKIIEEEKKAHISKIDVNAPNQNEEFDINNAGLAYFLPEDSNPRKKRKVITCGTVRTPLGTIFGDRDIQNLRVISTTKSNIKYTTLRDSLFKSAKDLFDTQLQLHELVQHQELSLEMIEVDFKSVDDVKATVECIFCQKKSKVFFRTSERGLSGSWVLSNLKKHIINCLNPGKRDDKRQKLRVIDAMSERTSPANTSTIGLNLEPSTSADAVRSDLRDILFKQMTVQNIKIVNSAIKHNEPRQKCSIGVGNSGASVDVSNIIGDGDCAFGSIAHQLFCVEINSPEHKEWTQKLRKDVVEYIQSNLSIFTHEIRGRILAYQDKFDDINAETTKFLKKLACPGFYGGGETFKALALNYSINIVVFNENGPCYFANRFNKDFDRTIFIAFRGDGSNTGRNHYDTVIEINEDLVDASIEILIESEVQYMLNIGKTEIVSIDDSLDD